MKNYTGCKYADWEKTKSGKLHPSGDGRCTFVWKIPPLSQCMYWLGVPYPSGGHINRKTEFEIHCVYYLKEIS